MKRARLAIGALGATLFVFVVANANCSTREPIPNGFTLEETPKTGRFIIYGDTRRWMPGEPYLRETSYDRERQLVADRLVVEKPDLIIHSGDLVGRGSSGTQWDEEWDRQTEPLRRAGVPIYMSYGNHEYWFDAGEAMTHIAQRFPRQQLRHWYALRYGQLLFIMLDSNFTELQPDEIRRQDAWLGGALLEADKDPSVRFVFAVFHHPLYTNSRVHNPDEKSRAHFLPRLVKCPKVRAVFNGHVHNYERFLIDGIHFVVAGGGGAPKTAVNTKTPKFKDEFGGPEVRPFQYCLLTVHRKSVVVDVMMLREDDGSWYRGDGFIIE